MSTVYLGLGSNLGDRQGHLRRALGLLKAHLAIRQVSALYETEPLGYAAQPRFLNAAVVGETELAPHELLAWLKELERQMGRRPTVRNGPRVIDVDILSYEGEILDTPDLHLPHPRVSERAFVLVPLAEIDPRWRHPLSRRTATELLGEVDGVTGVHLYRRDWAG